MEVARMSEILAKFLPLGLMLLMLVVGLRLEPRGLGRVFVKPTRLFLGLAVQWLGLPILALLLAMLFDLSQVMTAGLVLIALAPGGVTSNYIAHLAHADLALSTAMTLVTTLFAGISIPLALALTGVATMPDGSGLLAISAKMSVVAIVPVLLGMTIGALWRGFSARLLSWLEPIARLVFATMVLATFIQNWDAMWENLGSVGAAVVSLNVGALVVAWGVSDLAALPGTSRRAIMVEASLQNVAVALFLASHLLQEPTLSVPALIYAVVMNVAALAQIVLARRFQAA